MNAICVPRRPRIASCAVANAPPNLAKRAGPADSLVSEGKLSGMEARLQSQSGDVVHIPGNVEHGYDVLEPDSVDLEFYGPMREDFLK